MALKNKYDVTLDGEHLGNIDANDETHAERLAQQRWPHHSSDDLLEVSKRPLKSPLELAKASSPQLAGHKRGVLDPDIPGDAASYGWHRSFKNPKDLSNKIAKENERREHLSKLNPLEEFQNYEAANFYGSLWDDDRRFYGIKEPHSITYPELLDSYKKSKGVHAKNIDPSVQKYFNDQLAKRQSILDRFKKIPLDKSADFQLGLGYELDPFDFEEEYFIPEDLQNGSSLLDYDPWKWETIENYLTKKGY